MRRSSIFLALWIVAAVAAVPLCSTAHADGLSLTGWIDSVPGQFGGGSDEAPSGVTGSSDSSKSQLSISAGLRLFIFGRSIHTTHISTRPKPATPWPPDIYNHEQTDQGSDWYIVHRVGAICISGDYVLNKDMRVQAVVLLGATAATLEYRVGTGNTFFNPGNDTSIVLDTKVGYIPLDMFYGLDLIGYYSMGDFEPGARIITHIGSAPFEETAFIGGTVDGWVTYFAFDMEAFASYKTKYGVPWAGIGLSFYKGWSHQQTVGTATTYDYRFNFREEMPFTFIGGYRVDTKDGHYIALEFAMIGRWSFGMEVGLKFM